MLGESCSWFKEKPVTLSGEGATERAAIAIAEQEGSRTDGGGSQVFIKDDPNKTRWRGVVFILSGNGGERL